MSPSPVSLDYGSLEPFLCYHTPQALHSSDSLPGDPQAAPHPPSLDGSMAPSSRGKWLIAMLRKDSTMLASGYVIGGSADGTEPSSTQVGHGT